MLLTVETVRAVAARARWSAALAAVALLAGSGAGWTSRAAAAAPIGANVTVDATHGLGTVPATAFGMNTAVWDGLMNDAPVAGLMRSAGIGVMRYPGGSYGDIYHWQTNTATGGYVAPNTSFDTFMGTARSAGAQPIVIADYGSGTPQEAAAWVQYANVTKGYGARYWEIGNEVYGNGHYGANWETDTHPDKSPTGYANDTLQYVSAMKAADPTVKVGAVLTTPGNWPDGVVGSGDSADWNHTVLPILGSKIDFVIVHWYPNSTSESQMLGQPSQIAGMVSTLRSLINQYAGANAPNVQIMMTEGNAAFAIDSQAAALFASDSYMSWLEHGVANVDWWNTHNGAGTVSTDSDGGQDFNDQGIISNASCSNGVCEPAAETPFKTYYGIEMLASLAAPGDQMVGTSSDHSLVAVHAVRRAGGGLDVLLINKDPQNSYTVSLAYSGFSPAASPTVSFFGEGSTSIATRQQGTAAAQVIPPYSLTTVHLQPAGGGGPSAPANLTASVTPTTVNLSWSASTPNVTGYQVFQKGATTDTLVGSSSTTSFTVAGLTPSTPYSFYVRAVDSAGRLSAPSSTITATTAPSPVGGALKAEYQNDNNSPHGQSIAPGLEVTNTGTAPANLSQVTLRYWFTRDGGATTFSTWCDWAQIGCANVTQRIVTLATPRGGADSYLEVGFTAGAGNLAVGANTGPIMNRFNKTDWSNFDQTNDYSHGTNTSYIDWTKVTVYVNGVLAWGTEPA